MFLKSTFAIIISAVFATSCHADLVDNLQGYWQFDGNGVDSSGFDRDLTVNGGGSYQPGLFGQAVDFTGKDQNKFASRLVDDDVYDVASNDFSFQTWVNYDATGSEQVLAEKWVGDGGPGWTLTKLSDNSFRFHLDAGLALDSSVQTISAGVWNHILVRRSGSNFEILFNGNAIISQDIGVMGASDTTVGLLIGKRNPGDSRNFSSDAFYDEVAFWDRALTNQEATFLYNGGAGNLISVPEPGSIAIVVFGGAGLVFRRRR